MKKTTATLLLSAIFAAPSLFANSVFWVKLTPKFLYQDATFSCSDTSAMMQNLYLVVTVGTNGTVTHAEFRDSTDYSLHTGVLPNEDTAKIKIAKDALGSSWITELPASTPVLAYLFYNVGEPDNSLFGCVPPQQISSVTPAQDTFLFKQKDSDTYFVAQHSYSGINVLGKPYSIKLGFTETMLYQTP